MSDSATPQTAACQASFSFTISQSLLKFIFIHSVMPSSHPVLCHLLLLPSVFPSIRVFSNKSALPIRWPKYWSFSFSTMYIQGWFPLGMTGLISLLSKRLSRIFSNITFQKHLISGAQPSLWFNSHICTWLQEKPQLWLYRLCQQSDVSAFKHALWVCHNFPFKEQASLRIVLIRGFQNLYPRTLLSHWKMSNLNCNEFNF